MSELVKRPALRYYGGKFALADWIIGHFPKHDHYVEPCFGAGSVLLKKPAVKLETVNDLNGRVTNYFKVLRDRGAELIRALDLTPWAVDEYKLSQISAEDSLEDARRFHLLCWMSINGGPTATGFRCQNSLKSRYASPPSDLVDHDLHAIIKRLKNVQVLNEDALKMLTRYEGVFDVLIYFDPPYLPEKRGNKNGYSDHEVSEDFHIQASELLLKVPGHVVVSGYESELYNDLYEGFTQVKTEGRTNSGASKTECLYIAPQTAEALKLPTQPLLLAAL